MRSICPSAALALRLGEVFKNELTLAELRYPTLSRRAKALLDSDPAAYGRILEDLLDGIAPEQVALKRKQTPDFIRFLVRLHPEIHATVRAGVISNLEFALAALSRRLLDEAAELPIAHVPRAIQLATEQLALLTGNATQRVEHTAVPSREKLLEMFQALGKKGKMGQEGYVSETLR